MAHQFSALVGINLINDGFRSGNVKIFKDIGLGWRPELGARNVGAHDVGNQASGAEARLEEMASSRLFLDTGYF